MIETYLSRVLSLIFSYLSLRASRSRNCIFLFLLQICHGRRVGLAVRTMAGFRLLITISLALLFALLLECFLLLILVLLDLICPPALSQYILPSLKGIKKLLVEYWIALLAHVRLGYILIVDADSNADVMLPNATFIACNPRLVVIITSLDSTANAANDFDLFFLLGGLLGFLRGFLLWLRGLVKEIETLRVLSFRRPDGSSGFI